MGFLDLINSLIRREQKGIKEKDNLSTSSMLIDLPNKEIKPKQPLLSLPGLTLYNPEEFTAPPQNKVIENGVGERRRVAGLWNNYGQAILDESKRLNIEPAIALAVFSVESGRAYDNDTHLVIIRFEPHVYKHYSGKEISAPHTSQAAEWQSFKDAYLLDPKAAMLSTSFGLPQIMGFNHKIVSYREPEDMIFAFQNSCVNQIEGFFNFCVYNDLDVKIKNEDFVGFALKYNGSGREQLYAAKIKAYLTHARDLLK